MISFTLVYNSNLESNRVSEGAGEYQAFTFHMLTVAKGQGCPPAMLMYGKGTLLVTSITEPNMFLS